MNKFFVRCAILITVLLPSCNFFDEVVPEIDTTFTKTFLIRIFSNEGISAPQTIDVSSSDEYNDFKKNIESFKLQKVTYKINNDNVPKDMYLSGEVVCNNEEDTESYIVGTIPKAKLSEMALSDKEYNLVNTSDLDKIISWLNSPGRFEVSSDYKLTNPDGTPYFINTDISGSNFELVVNFYVKVKTKI